MTAIERLHDVCGQLQRALDSKDVTRLATTVADVVRQINNQFARNQDTELVSFALNYWLEGEANLSYWFEQDEISQRIWSGKGYKATLLKLAKPDSGLKPMHDHTPEHAQKCLDGLDLLATFNVELPERFETFEKHLRAIVAKPKKKQRRGTGR